MKPACIITFVFCLFVLDPTAWAQRTQNPAFSGAQIQVQVRYPGGSVGPRGAMVLLEQDGAGIVGQAQSDGMGKASFHPPGPGFYVVSVREPGYEQASERINLNTNPNAYVTLNLKPLPGAGKAIPPEGPAGGLPAVPQPAMKEFEEGQKLLKEKKDADGGIRHLLKAIELYKPFSQARMLLGLVYLDQHNWEDAQKTFEQAIKIDPKSAGSHLGLGAAYNGQKNFDAAEKELQTGLEINPDAPEGQYELAKTYWANGKWQDAEPHVEKAVALQPDFAHAHVLLGNVLLRKRDNNGALHEFKEYLRLEPNGPMAEQARTIVAKIEKALAAQ